MATKKIETGELCKSLSVKRNMYSIFYIFQEVISTPYKVFTKAKACDWLVTRIRKEITSQNTKENSQHAWVMRILKVLCEFRITWSSWLPKAISSSFQLQIMHGLKHWILDFQSFEMVYSMQKMDFGKCSKSAKED